MKKYNILYKKLIRFAKENNLYNQYKKKYGMWFIEPTHNTYRKYVIRFLPTTMSGLLPPGKCEDFMELSKEYVINLIYDSFLHYDKQINKKRIEYNYNCRTLISFIDTTSSMKNINKEEIYKTIYDKMNN